MNFPLTERQRKIISNVHMHAQISSPDGTPQIKSLRDGWKKLQRIDNEADSVKEEEFATRVVKVLMIITGLIILFVAYRIIVYPSKTSSS
eukprot:scaffold256_cov175-Ochromonas_danica.AAC.8